MFHILKYIILKNFLFLLYLFEGQMENRTDTQRDDPLTVHSSNTCNNQGSCQDETKDHVTQSITLMQVSGIQAFHPHLILQILICRKLYREILLDSNLQTLVLDVDVSKMHVNCGSKYLSLKYILSFIFLPFW